jgi:hypothetical protein
MPAPQTAQENCVAHNGSIVPVPGRDIKVQAWYQGGVSVFDFTDPAKPFEIAFFDRGPLDATHLITGGYWSTYWFNGHIYGAEMARGLDVFRLTPSEHLSQAEIEAAESVQVERFNVQHQDPIGWPAHPIVARAYLAQLERSGTLPAARAATVRNMLSAIPGGGGTTQSADTMASHKDVLADLGARARKAEGVDAARLRGLVSTLRALTDGRK